MILIDGHFFLHRYLSITEGEEFKQLKKDHKKGNERQPTKDELMSFQTTFLHLFLYELIWLKRKNYQKFGDIAIAFDSYPSWRKDLFPKYKSNRDEKKLTTYDILLKRLMKHMKENVIDVLSETNITPVIVERCEGDDIIPSLCDFYQSPHLIVAADQDFKQLLSSDIKMFNPITKKQISTPSKREMELWKITNIIAGQRKDGIPPIVHYCKISKEFVQYMEEEYDIDISVIELKEIEKKFSHFIEEYEKKMNDKEAQLVKDGKKKKKKKWSAYENKPFGEAAAMKFYKDFDSMMENPCYNKNYERNKRLLLFEHIPDDIKKSVVMEYQKKKLKFFNEVELMNKLQKYRLFELTDKIDWF